MIYQCSKCHKKVGNGNIKLCKKCECERRKREISLRKRIKQLDLQGNELTIWNSVAEAGRCLDIRSDMISRVLIGRRQSTHEFIFKYV